jgi:sugar phosphate isomerase/epimerase
MTRICRRDFFGVGAAVITEGALVGCGVATARSTPLGMPVGLQIYVVRALVKQDFEGTMHRIADIGYRSIELISPTEARLMGLGDFEPDRIRRVLKQTGLRCESCHFMFDELENHLDESMAFALDVGLTTLISAVPAGDKKKVFKQGPTPDDWDRTVQVLNAAGKKAKRTGLRVGYHNHQIEWQDRDGRPVYDWLLEKFDPALVVMQLDIGGILLAGHDPIDYLQGHPGRFYSLHIKDKKSNSDDLLPIGKGDVDWQRLFYAARIGGIRNYFVESGGESIENLRSSFNFLEALGSRAAR